MTRCLGSIADADYGNDNVNLHVFIDHFKEVVSQNASLDLDTKLDNSHRILDFVDKFHWAFGEKLLHYRTANVGLQAQWLEAWWPSSDNEFAFVVEDDLEVSPLYYKFLKGLITNYYYNVSNYSPSVYGASLQRPRFVPGKHGNKMHLDSETRLFLYQLVGTWGQLLFPKPWKEFRLWYDIHKAKGFKPLLQGMVTTGWYKRMGERIWTPWFIKFVHSRGYFNIYTNFLHERALSTSHRDAGVNYGKTVGPDSKLIDETSLDFDLLEMPPLNSLKWYDFCFNEVLPDRVIRSLDELGSVLHSVQKQDTVLLVSLYRVSEKATKNLLCHFGRLNIRNYILLGPKTKFMLDLARRGHLVIDVDQFLNSIRAYKSVGELMKEVIVKAYIIKQCLELKFSSWVVDGNMLFLESNLFFYSVNLSCDIYAGNTSEILFVRSSSSIKKTWDDGFIYKVASMVNSSSDRDSLSSETTEFVYRVAKLLEQNGDRIQRIDEHNLIMKIDSSSTSGTTLEDGKKIILWSSGRNASSIQKRLADLGMWILDEDSSCTAVFCHGYSI